MKSAIFLFSLLLAMTGCTSTGGDSTGDEKDPPKPIVDPVKPSDFIQIIKADYQVFQDHRGDYQSEVVEFEPQGGGGSGKFTAYTDGDDLLMLREDLYDDHGPMYTEYYLKNDRCYFIFEHSELDEIVSGTTHITQDRYYLNEGNLLLRYNKRNKFAKGQDRDMSKVPNEEMPDKGEEAGAELEHLVNSAQERFQAARSGS